MNRVEDDVPSIVRDPLSLKGVEHSQPPGTFINSKKARVSIKRHDRHARYLFHPAPRPVRRCQRSAPRQDIEPLVKESGLIFRC